MSQVNQAGSVSVLWPRHSLLRKIFDVFIWEAGLAWPSYPDLGFYDRDLGNRIENFPYEHSSPTNWDEI